MINHRDQLKADSAENHQQPKGTRLIALLSIGLVSIALSCVVVGALVEIGFRWWGYMKKVDLRLYTQELARSDRLPSSLFHENNTLPYVLMKPSTQALATTSDFSVIYAANSVGIRDKEYDRVKTPGTTRCLLFGDSFTFGEGVADGQRFADIVENKVPNLEIINFGMPGYGIDTELVLYEMVAKQFEHDCVIVATNWLDAERDFSQIYSNGVVDLQKAKPLAAGVRGKTTLLSRNDKRLTTRWPLSKQSYFIAYLQYQWLRKELATELAKTDLQVWRSLNDYIFRSRGAEEKNQIEERTKAILRTFVGSAQQQGAKFIIINIDPDEPMPFLGEIDPAIKYYSYQQQLESLGQTQPLRFTYDFHFTAATHRAIGEWLSLDMANLLHSSAK